MFDLHARRELGKSNTRIQHRSSLAAKKSKPDIFARLKIDDGMAFALLFLKRQGSLPSAGHRKLRGG